MDKCDLILESLKNIETRLTKLEEINNIVQKDCSKMSNHINFIEHTYTLIRTPLGYFKNNIEYLMGNTNNNNNLPLINNNNNNFNNFNNFNNKN